MFARLVAFILLGLVGAEEHCDKLECMGKCVRIVSSECAGGTANISELTNTSRLLVMSFTTGAASDGVDEQFNGGYVVADVESLTWTVCPNQYVFPAKASECPPNLMDPVGLQYWWMTGIVICGLILCACLCRRVLPQTIIFNNGNCTPVDVAIYWFLKFWVAVAIGIICQEMYMGSSISIQKLGMNFAASYCLWDGFSILAKYCLKPCVACVKRDLFNCAIGAWAMCWAWVAFNIAYTPSEIALMGHHPLRLGIYTFCLSIPQAAVQRRFCGECPPPKKNRDAVYIPCYSELVWPLLGLDDSDDAALEARSGSGLTTAREPWLQQLA